MPTGNDFRKAFSSAKKKGQKTFTYKGKKYTTTTAAEKAKKNTLRQNLTAASKTGLEAGTRQFKSKSHNEIANSYGRAYSKQYNSMSLSQRRKHDASLKKKKY